MGCEGISIPGSIPSANDQPDKGPVMLRTVTQTSSKVLKGRQHIKVFKPYNWNVIYNASWKPVFSTISKQTNGQFTCIYVMA